MCRIRGRCRSCGWADDLAWLSPPLPRPSRWCPGSVSSGISPPPACQENASHPVVQHGRAPSGQVWRLVTCPARTSPCCTYGFRPSTEMVGGSVTVPRPTSRVARHRPNRYKRRGRTALLGRSGRQRHESQGHPLRRPAAHHRAGLAPAALRQRYPYLRGVRFIGVVYSGSHRGTARKACAITPSGRQLRCRFV